MSASDVSISNRALQILGATAITSLDDENAKARAMKLAYEMVRRSEIRANRWRFAIKRISLPALSSAPDSDYVYQYQLPNDYLRLIPGGDLRSVPDLADYQDPKDGLYSVEGSKILTDLPAPLAIRYLADITDAASFDSTFVEMFAASLAKATCETITESSQKLDNCERAYRSALRMAKQAGAFEKAPAQAATDTWVTARLG